MTVCFLIRPLISLFTLPHYKVGTSWFKNILSAIAEEFACEFIHSYPARLSGLPAIFFQGRPLEVGEFRGSHMIRDLRDVVISVYYYHLWTNEKWAITQIREREADVQKKLAASPRRFFSGFELPGTP